jgi:hypothetical protein
MKTKPVSSKSWTRNRRVGFAISLISIAASAYFPGAGFVVFFALQKRLDQYKRLTVIALIVLELIYLVTALGTLFGPVIGHVGPVEKA